MTVSAQPTINRSTGNGVTTVFPYQFKIVSESDIEVSVDAVVKTLNVDYTVSGVGSDSGGNVTFSSAPANATTVVRRRKMALVRTTDYQDQGEMPAATVDADMDSAILMIQQLQEEVDRSLNLPVSSTASTTLPTPQANTIVGWNVAGDALQNVPLSQLATSISYGTARSDIFTGDGSTQTFTLSENPGSQANLDVAIGGVTQLPGTDYTWSSGTSLVFSSAPPLGAKILARYMQGLAQGTSDSASAAFIQAGAGAVTRTAQDKIREWVSAADFGAVAGGDVGAAVNLALAAGHSLIRVKGTYTISTPIVMNAKSGVILDMSESTVTAASSLNASLVRLLNCTRCEVRPGVLNGNAAGQTLSSFGIDLNGGSYNRVIGGRVTNCKTYGIYNINCNWALVEGVEADNNQQSGIAGDAGGSTCVGFRVRNVVVHDNGLGGVGTLAGLYLEGIPGSGIWWSELDIDGVISYNNRGAGVAGQGWQFYSLSNIKARNNYAQGIALFCVLYGRGGNFVLNNNAVGGTAGYRNGIRIDEAGVTPASQYNTFSNIFSANHPEYSVIESGTANNNSFIGLDSVSDGAVFALIGASSIGLRRNAWQGNQTIAGKFTVNAVSGGIGYSAGSGGTVTQTTNKDTDVTLNALSGRITMNNAALGAGALAQFTMFNSSIESTDVLVFNVVSGATQAAYAVNARPLNGQAVIEVRNRTASSLSEALVIAFVVIKGAVS